MRIEERIEHLEELFQKLHGKMGHKWFRGEYSGWKECACGARSYIGHSDCEYDRLPTRYQLDEEL